MRILYVNILWLLSSGVLSDNPAQNQDERLVLSYNENSSENGTVEIVGMKRNNYDQGLCRSQFKELFDRFNSGDTWARKVLDSWGNLPPGGHLAGRFVDLGNFDECMSQTYDLGGVDNTFIPQYCLASYPLDDIYRTTNEGGIRMERLFVETKDPTDFLVGVCVPDTCDMDALNDFFKELFYNKTNNTLSNNIFSEALCTPLRERHFDGVDIFAITIFGLIGLLMLLSSIYDFYTSKYNKQKNALLLSFSVITNARKLFHVENKPSANTIECLNGIRSLSIMWIIYGHTLLVMAFMPLLNYNYYWEWVSEYYSMLVISGPVAVDSFFLLSGILVTFHLYKEIDTRGRLTIGNILNMYFHRYLRLFPLLAATILFAATLYKYVGDGPYWNSINSSIEAPCRVFWWSALLHLQNYVNSSAMCLGHTWYLSADTQLYILSPLILIPLKKWGKRFLPVIGLLTFASCLYIFVIMITYNFSMKIIDGSVTGDNDKKVMLYYGFHTRAPSWLAGVVLGHILYSVKGKKLQINKFLILGGWVSSFVVFAAIIWGPYEGQQRFAEPSKVESAFFEALSRLSWAVALAWIVFICCQGRGGIINSFLSCPLWQPLSRLSYAIYIIHLVVQITVVGLVRTDVYLSNYSAIRTFWGDFGIMLGIATVMVLAFEAPTAALEKYFLGGKVRPVTTENPQNTVAGSVETLESGITESVKS
ncbi:unnamed protein product [Hermetia illucens]|uniref:Nose resistant-to-fluoxetine protein N-terminal domain-containing protein n=1 Tax=Hermetia illucens TaxID=343691 RepID=A0A7R8V129_HERIL|nr:nose resistant to fluoxetine protein 6-like [Hermetia illucens]CAD7090161.1 unnamed protein product [Hermetia illucens]